MLLMAAQLPKLVSVFKGVVRCHGNSKACELFQWHPALNSGIVIRA